MPEPACGNCRFWRPRYAPPAGAPGARRVHECRRRAPGGGGHREWPTTAEDDWCGEHEQARPAEGAPDA